MTANLLSRLQGLEGPDREVDALICVALQYGGPNSEGATNVRRDSDWDENDLIFEVNGEPSCNRIPELTASLDATVALCERVLPAKWPDILREALRLMGQEYDWHISIDRQPPELLCKFVLTAILTALEARENG